MAVLIRISNKHLWIKKKKKKKVLEEIQYETQSDYYKTYREVAFVVPSQYLQT